jgi:prolyl oligopeptidase
MTPMRRVPRLSGAALALSSCIAGALSNLPVQAPRDPVTEVHFGITVTDPYRWMEDTQSAATQNYLKSQSGYTQTVLAGLAGPRDELLARIRQLDAAVDSVPLPASYQSETVYAVGRQLFYKKVHAGDTTASLYVRTTGAIDERRLLDPARFDNGEGRANIAYFVPSPDGRYVAFGVSLGSETIQVHVIGNDGAMLSESIANNTAANISWADNRHFVYVRPSADTDAKVASYGRSGVYLHEVGKPAASDRLLFGYGYSKAIPFGPDDFSYITCPAGSGYLVASMTYGVQYHRKVLYVAPAGEVLHGQPPTWTRVAATEDEVDDFEMHGATLYVLTHKASPNRDVRSIKLPGQSFDDAAVVMPPSERVIASISAARDALYVTEQHGVLQRLQRLGYPPGARPQDVALPYTGSITVRTAADAPGGVVSVTSWTHYPLWYQLNTSGHFADTRIQPAYPVDFSQVVAEEVPVPSSGGVQVPLSILHVRGLQLDGSHPVWLEGYGAYGGAITPDFDPARLAWLERGGVYAVAHVRGGGEFGERWHADGILEHKQNGIDDFIASARYLIKSGYTNSAHLAAVGASAGGMLVANAMVQHPELFGAVLDIAGATDMVRFMQTPGGRLNVKEFGDIDTADGFRAVFAVDPYQHVQDHTPYPAVLLTGGVQDSRVPVWEPAKMAARLQAATASARPVLLSIDFHGGHGISGSLASGESKRADSYAFLLWQLGDPGIHKRH